MIQNKELKEVTLWDETAPVGLRFTEGDTLQTYTSAIVVSDLSLLETEEGMAIITAASERLHKRAAQEYPKEFAPLKN